MGIICGISLSLLVVVAGLFLLAKTKKEQLNNMFTFASFTVIILGILLMIATFFGGMCHVMSNKCGERGMYQERHCFMNDCCSEKQMNHKKHMSHDMSMCGKEQKMDGKQRWGKKGKCFGGEMCDKKNCDMKDCKKKHIKVEVHEEIVEEEAEE
ncbi:MAG: hypothetical protein ABII90_14695 [Bacteroidota bacterium]